MCMIAFSCAHHAHEEAPSPQGTTVSAASFLGNELGIDSMAGSQILAREKHLDVQAWKLDDSFLQLIQAGSKERGKEFRPLDLNSAEIQRAVKIRESRWKKTLGKYNQALLDAVLREAEKQGVRQLLFISPLESMERFPSYRGPVGIHCNNAIAKGGRAYAYFEWDVSLWDVPTQKKLFQVSVDPSLTEILTFADCQTAAQLSEPVTQLEDPVKKTLGLVADAIFDKMGWKRLP
jgi:hypothetical protein